MKNKVLLVAVVATLFAVSLSAQTETNSSLKSNSEPLKNKRGIVITPEQGDFAIGIDATPFLNYLGNFLKISDESNEAPTFGFTAQNPGMIFGKYMLTNTKALNVAFRIGISNTTIKDGTGINNEDTDKYITSAVNIGLSAGIEHSPIMKSRIRGFFGYMASVGIAPYEGVSYVSPGTEVVGRVSYKDGVDSDNDFIEKGGSTYSAGVGGMVGVEYFFAPKLSLRGQFNLMVEYQYQNKRKYIPETGSEVIIDSGMSMISLDNMASGSIAMLFYF